MSLISTLILLFILVVFSALLSLSETSIIGLSKIRLHRMVSQGVKRAQGIHRLLMKSDKLIAAILIGNNIVNISISAIATGIFVQILGLRLGVALSTFVTTFAILVLCEMTPKILAIKHAEKVALFVAPIMEVCIKILQPLTSFFIGISNFILKIFRVSPAKRSPLITEEELRTMIEVGKEEGVLSDEERAMLHRIFEFGDTKVAEVMAAKDKMIALDLNSTSEDLLNIFVEEGHTRLPVYSGSKENIIGIVYARDLLYVLKDKSLFLLADLLHKPYFVPAEMRVSELLKKFQSEKIQIAIVIDENKKALGLVTLEDLMEEIVGEIEERPVGLVNSSLVNKS
ncbi:MAG: hemolysin family protein [Candidatus Omnitrophota bacterium]|nr:hemolysin family protein [Candidatus Omnitrophota bacterium]